MNDITRPPGRPKTTNPKSAAVSFRFSHETAAMLRVIADELGIAQTAVIELALRDIAKARGIPWQKTPKV